MHLWVKLIPRDMPRTRPSKQGFSDELVLAF